MFMAVLDKKQLHLLFFFLSLISLRERGNTAKHISNVISIFFAVPEKGKDQFNISVFKMSYLKFSKK